LNLNLRQRIEWGVRTPPWFRGAVVLGVAVRLYLCLFTEGTYDVPIWKDHAARISRIGLIAYYHENPNANHPPFASMAITELLRASERVGVPFRVALRAALVFVDTGTFVLLLLALRGHPRRLQFSAGFWLHPLAFISSGYHGNTDSAVAFFVMLSVFLLSRRNTIGGAIAVGLGLWIKLPVVLAVPALLILVDGLRDKAVFLSVAGATAIASYLPALIADPGVVLSNVFGYRGLTIETSAGVPAWGWYRVLMPFVASAEWLENPGRLFEFLVLRDWQLALALIGFVAWRRRALRTLSEVCVTIAMSFVLVYGLTENWAFQYFAWSVPFWCFMPLWFIGGATVLASGYIYALYRVLCGNPWLLGTWDFMGHPTWPAHVVALRDLSVLFFLASACWFVIRPVTKPKP